MKFRKITNIGRKLDPSYPTNLAILILTALVSVSMTILPLLDGIQFIPAVIVGLRSGMIFFLGWAIAREYDPDHQYSAFAAAAVILMTFLVGFSADLLLLGWVLLMLRYINRSTGMRATVIDLLGGFLVTLWLVYSKDWIIGLLAAAAYALDGFFSGEKTLRYLFAAVALGTAIVAWLLVPSSRNFVGFNFRVIMLSGGMILLSIPLLVASHEIRSLADLNEKPMQPARVQAAQAFFVVTVLLAGLKLGTTDSSAIITLGSVVVGTAIYFFLGRLFPPRE